MRGEEKYKRRYICYHYLYFIDSCDFIIDDKGQRENIKKITTTTTTVNNFNTYCILSIFIVKDVLWLSDQFKVHIYTITTFLQLFANISRCFYNQTSDSIRNTGWSGKIVFFHNSLQPLPGLHRCKRPSKHSYWMVFFVQPITAKCWCGRGGKLLRILEKKYLMNTLYIRWSIVLW